MELDAHATPEGSASSQPSSADAVVLPAPSPTVGTPPVAASGPRVANGTTTALVSTTGRQMSGMKPVVPLRKRGASFRETKSVVTMVDADGKRHLNQ